MASSKPRQGSKSSSRPSFSPSFKRRNTFETLVEAGRALSNSLSRAVHGNQSSADLKSSIRHLGPTYDAESFATSTYRCRVASDPSDTSYSSAIIDALFVESPSRPGFFISSPGTTVSEPTSPPSGRRLRNFGSDNFTLAGQIYQAVPSRLGLSDEDLPTVSQIPSPAGTPRHLKWRERVALAFGGPGVQATPSPSFARKTSTPQFHSSQSLVSVHQLLSPEPTPCPHSRIQNIVLRHRPPPVSPLAITADRHTPASAPPYVQQFSIEGRSSRELCGKESRDLWLESASGGESRSSVTAAGSDHFHRQGGHRNFSVIAAYGKNNTMAFPQSKLKTASLQPSAAAGSRFRQIEAAKEEQKHIDEIIGKYGLSRPQYELLELIGKGTFGRVYKSKSLETQTIVAIKIISVDSFDYEEAPGDKDDNMESLIKEIRVLQQLKDSRATNVNTLYEAFSVHSMLWIVTEYCPGGSVHTLMKPFENGLDETFIIPIAREVAVALKYIHEAGIIHRDIKCANILITQDGRVQLCDFGIAGVVESEVGKRSTIIGTPNWMPPEMHMTSNFTTINYGTEVDCWAFGSTVFEMASGMPPNAKFHPSMLHKVLSVAPKLEGDHHSPELKQFVAFCLRERPQDRPSALAILQHPYIENTSQTHPAEGLGQLLDNYAVWEQAGNYRMSLFNQYGAVAAGNVAPNSAGDDEWNFSTTADYDQKIRNRVSAMIEQTSDDDSDFSLAGRNSSNMGKQTNSRLLTPADRVQNELRVQRGQRAMVGVFNQDSAPYKYGESPSDLPFRQFSSETSANRTTMIDLDMAAPTFGDDSNFDLADPATLRASKVGSMFKDDYDNDDAFSQPSDRYSRRETKDWKFPFEQNDPKRKTQDWKFPLQEEKRKTQDWKFPFAEEKRKTQDWKFPSMESEYDTKRWTGASRQSQGPEGTVKRRTQDWKFPVMDDIDSDVPAVPEIPEQLRPESIPGPGFPAYRSESQATDREDFSGTTQSAPESPNRSSMIDLDAAFIEPVHRPSTAGSESQSILTDMTSGNPFDLEPDLRAPDESKNRTSMHSKSQSEPPHGYRPPSEVPVDLISPPTGRDADVRSNGSISSLGGTTQLSFTQQQMDRLHNLADRVMSWVNESTEVNGDVERGRSSQADIDAHHLARIQTLNRNFNALVEQQQDPELAQQKLDSWLGSSPASVSLSNGDNNSPGQTFQPGSYGRPICRNQNGRPFMEFPTSRQIPEDTLEHGASELELQAAVMATAADMMSHFSLAAAAFDSVEDQNGTRSK